MRPVRWSELKHIRRSPAHYRYACEKGVTETSAMRVGAYVHQLVLGGIRKFRVYDGVRRGSSWEMFQAANETATILTLAEWAQATEIARAVHECEAAVRILDGIRERTIEWEVAGRFCIGTPDVAGESFVADLKVTNDASPSRFPWHARRQGWLGQLEWYANGLGGVAEAFLVAVESKPPYPVVVYMLTEAARDVGQRQWRSYFETLRVCEEADSWPGYSQGIAVLDVADEEDVSLTVNGEEMTL